LVLTKVEAGDGKVRVKDIYPNFKRDTPAHEVLRGLRDAQFIRPVDSGRFHPDSVLQMKQFGRLMLQHQREYILPKNRPNPSVRRTAAAGSDSKSPKHRGRRPDHSAAARGPSTQARR